MQLIISKNDSPWGVGSVPFPNGWAELIQFLPDLRQIKVRIFNFCFVWWDFFSVTVSSVLFSKIKFQGNVVASSECIQLLCSECTSHPAQLAEDVRFSLRSVPLLPAVTLAFLNLFAEQSNVSKSLCFMSCIITSVWMWDGDTSVRKTWTGLIWCHFSLLAAALGHTTAFTAVLARWGVWGGVAEQKVIMANHISVIVLLCAMDHCFFLRGFKWKKWLRWEKKNLYLQFF